MKKIQFFYNKITFKPQRACFFEAKESAAKAPDQKEKPVTNLGETWGKSEQKKSEGIVLLKLLIDKREAAKDKDAQAKLLSKTKEVDKLVDQTDLFRNLSQFIEKNVKKDNKPGEMEKLAYLTDEGKSLKAFNELPEDLKQKFLSEQLKRVDVVGASLNIIAQQTGLKAAFDKAKDSTIPAEVDAKLKKAGMNGGGL